MNRGILYFSAPWCEPCQKLGPEVNKLIKEGIKVRKVNIDYEASLTEKYKVKSVPTLILTDLAGNELKRTSNGNLQKEQLTEWYNG